MLEGHNPARPTGRQAQPRHLIDEAEVDGVEAGQIAHQTMAGTTAAAAPDKRVDAHAQRFEFFVAQRTVQGQDDALIPVRRARTVLGPAHRRRVSSQLPFGKTICRGQSHRQAALAMAFVPISSLSVAIRLPDRLVD